jgi:hypothetical protein
MPRYFFNLNDGRKVIPDVEGTELPDDDSARAHAAQVARELARNREQETRSWRLAVCDAQGTLRFEVLFASVGELPPRTRTVMRFMMVGEMVEDDSQSTASRNDAAEEVLMALPPCPPPHAGEGREGEDLGAV